MILKKVNMIFLQFVLLGTLVYSNSCPKWFPMPSNDGLVVVLPIYDEAITEPDMDCDGIIDTIDTDIDGDDVANSKDDFPLNSSESVDTDGDGIGNNADSDDDNDGTEDTEDSNPLVNEVPIAHAGDDQRTDANVTVALDASTSSDDGNILTYSWVLTNKPEGSSAVLNNSTVATPTFYADKVGTYRLELIVSDGILTSTKDVVFVNVGRESMLIAYDDGIHGKEPWITDGTPEGTHLLKDINIKNESSDITNIVDAGDVIYFSVNGNELWKSDGSDGGTIKVKMLDSSIHDLIVVNHILYFLDESNRLWKSNGTEEGTIRFIEEYFNASSLYVFNDTLYFKASIRDNESQSTEGNGLWKSDGTREGTFYIKEINLDAAHSFEANFVDINNTLYFSARDGIHGYELWKSDGTREGTQLLKDINIGSNGSSLCMFINLNDKLYFLADDGIHGKELWQSDGTEEGTQLVKDIKTGTDNSSFISNLIVNNNKLYFLADDGIHGNELWKSNGTEEGTQLVKDIIEGYSGIYLNDLIAVNNILYLNINGYQLWKSDGSEIGTVQINGNYNGISKLINYNDSLYFYIQNSINNDGLWKYNNDNSITRIKEVKIWNSYMTFVIHNDIMYFNASDSTNGYELWKSNGTEDSTTMVKNINTITYSSISNIYQSFTKIGSIFYFIVDIEPHNKELWKSDGTEEGTVKVKDIKAILYGKSFNFNVMNNMLYFVADDNMNNMGIWKSDGTVEGTVLVTSKVPEEKNLIVMNKVLYFTCYGIEGKELWKSDGTEEGTIKITNIGGDYINNFISMNNVLYFTVNDNNYNEILWRSDGTTLGTYKIVEHLSNIYKLHVYNNALYFNAYTNTYGNELWYSDGTQKGTKIVKDIVEGYDNFSPNRLTVVDKLLYFSGRFTSELWCTDGTAEKTINTFSTIDYFSKMIALNDTIYYLYNYSLYKNIFDKKDIVVHNLDYTMQLNLVGVLNSELLYSIEKNNEYKLWKTNESETIQLTP